ncbi:hypothetical protein N9496_06865 [Akkermansiaceae bacterium]|nr:hypothetical protein [Akkermansiaceae bacterium]
MNHVRTTLMAGLLVLTVASASGAQAPLSADALKRKATNIVSGTVVDVAVTTQKAKLESERGLFSRDRIFTIKLRVSNVSKGKAVKAGEEITIEAWQAHRRPPWHAGPQGHGNIPDKDDKITVYLKDKEGKVYSTIPPNGILINPLITP